MAVALAVSISSGQWRLSHVRVTALPTQCVGNVVQALTANLAKLHYLRDDFGCSAEHWAASPCMDTLVQDIHDRTIKIWNQPNAAPSLAFLDFSKPLEDLAMQGRAVPVVFELLPKRAEAAGGRNSKKPATDTKASAAAGPENFTRSFAGGFDEMGYTLGSQCTLATLQRVLERHSGIKVAHQTLTVDGVALEGQFEDTLASLGIVGGAHIGVSDRLRGGTMPISIKTLQLGGAVDFFMVDPSFTIRDIKLLIQDKRGFPPEQQRLVFDCQRLEDDNTLSYYNIQEHNCLNLLHLSGGPRARGRGRGRESSKRATSSTVPGQREHMQVITEQSQYEMSIVDEHNVNLVIKLDEDDSSMGSVAHNMDEDEPGEGGEEGQGHDLEPTQGGGASLKRAVDDSGDKASKRSKKLAEHPMASSSSSAADKVHPGARGHLHVTRQTTAKACGSSASANNTSPGHKLHTATSKQGMGTRSKSIGDEGLPDEKTAVVAGAGAIEQGDPLKQEQQKPVDMDEHARDRDDDAEEDEEDEEEEDEEDEEEEDEDEEQSEDEDNEDNEDNDDNDDNEDQIKGSTDVDMGDRHRRGPGAPELEDLDGATSEVQRRYAAMRNMLRLLHHETGLNIPDAGKESFYRKRAVRSYLEKEPYCSLFKAARDEQIRRRQHEGGQQTSLEKFLCGMFIQCCKHATGGPGSKSQLMAMIHGGDGISSTKPRCSKRAKQPRKRRATRRSHTAAAAAGRISSSSRSSKGDAYAEVIYKAVEPHIKKAFVEALASDSVRRVIKAEMFPEFKKMEGMMEKMVAMFETSKSLE